MIDIVDILTKLCKYDCQVLSNGRWTIVTKCYCYYDRRLSFWSNIEIHDVEISTGVKHDR